MKALRRSLQYLYVIWALLWFVVLMLIVVPFVLLAALFGKVKGGNITYRICNLWALAWYTVNGIRHKEIYESKPDPGQHYIFVANHSSYMDIPCIVRSIHQPMRVLGKYEMVKYPVFGIIYRMAVVLVDRRSAEKRAQSVRELKAALHKGISIFIFPEGTFNETGDWLKEFFDGAFRIAIETQTAIHPLLFVDTPERMHYSGFFTLTPGRCRVVFLEPIPVAGYSMKDMAQLKQLVHNRMEEGLKRYRELPASNKRV
ncbi:lysophospholipid acyltransferase family protein [Deminuibacter soli]|uniref:1-acyl-sn-glycerol-3-phosphate acyltransferase n=1 Tax=Deminuibacter soli TaxID=2291815 RepID=A0A3E1NIN5_9BACT|nr:lysophospholipid acyltransferase family protein [Deminuibacter soli]RFM27741.1 1-acyl-sn-glycerol-3-phosphate acyltransferase [Deminuibacter soli]